MRLGSRKKIFSLAGPRHATGWRSDLKASITETYAHRPSPGYQVSNPGLGGLLTAFERSEARRNCPRHLSQKIAVIKDFIERMDVTALEDVTVDAVENYVACLMDRGLAPKTVANRRGDIGRFCKWLCRRKYMRENPVLCVEPPKIRPTEIVYLDEAEFQQAVRIARKVPAAMVALYTGARVSEIMALRWRDIQTGPTGAFIVFGGTVPTKTDKVRSVPLHPILVRLSRRLGPRVRDEFIFPQTSRRTWDRMLKPFKDAIPTMARRGQGWHTFRRTFGSRLCARRTPIEVVSKLLGHSRLETTIRHYGHIDTEFGRKAVESL